MNDERVRHRIHEAIQEGITDDSDLDGAVLLSFVAIAEFQAPNREKWMTKVSGDPNGDCLPPWRERMFAYELCFHWENAVDAAEEEEDE